MADFEPGDGEHDPRQRRDRAQDAGQIGLGQVEARQRGRGQAHAEAQRRAQRQPPEIVDQAGADGRQQAPRLPFLRQRAGQREGMPMNRISPAMP
ncbi:hypothetical protein G6F65_022964 [Rhizopus arrhizus]|nr:hypothetical protein G6F65_022964 [Rhizopus arrhizus]